MIIFAGQNPCLSSSSNLLINPSFENSLNGWTCSPSASASLSTIRSSDGLNSLLLEGSLSSVIRCTNTISVSSLSYILSGYVYLEAGAANDKVSIFIGADNNDQKEIAINQGVGTSGDWIKFSIPLTSYSTGTMTITLTMYQQNADKIYIDDLAFTVASDSCNTATNAATTSSPAVSTTKSPSSSTTTRSTPKLTTSPPFSTVWRMISSTAVAGFLSICQYTVKSGDNLSSLAIKLETSVARLQQLNNLSNTNTVITVGQILSYDCFTQLNADNNNNINKNNASPNENKSALQQWIEDNVVLFFVPIVVVACLLLFCLFVWINHCRIRANAKKTLKKVEEKVWTAPPSEQLITNPLYTPKPTASTIFNNAISTYNNNDGNNINNYNNNVNNNYNNNMNNNYSSNYNNNNNYYNNNNYNNNNNNYSRNYTNTANNNGRAFSPVGQNNNNQWMGRV